MVIFLVYIILLIGVGLLTSQPKFTFRKVNKLPKIIQTYTYGDTFILYSFKNEEAHLGFMHDATEEEIALLKKVYVTTPVATEFNDLFNKLVKAIEEHREDK